MSPFSNYQPLIANNKKLIWHSVAYFLQPPVQSLGVKNETEEKGVAGYTKHMEKGSSGSIGVMEPDFDYLIDPPVPNDCFWSNFTGGTVKRKADRNRDRDLF